MKIKKEYKTKESTLAYLKTEECKHLSQAEKLQVWLDSKEQRRLKNQYDENRLSCGKVLNKLKSLIIRQYKLLRYGNRYYMGKPRFSSKLGSSEYTCRGHIYGTLSDFLNSESDVNKQIKEQEIPKSSTTK